MNALRLNLTVTGRADPCFLVLSVSAPRGLCPESEWTWEFLFEKRKYNQLPPLPLLEPIEHVARMRAVQFARLCAAALS